MYLTKTMRDAFVSAAMADVPKIDYQAKTIKVVQEYLNTAMPADVQAIWNNPEKKAYIGTSWESYGCTSMCVPTPMCGQMDAKTKKLVEEYATLNLEQIRKHQELKDKLSAVAMACTTRAQLVEALPEFEKYLPEKPEKACKTLPAVANVLSDFVKAGWPKNLKKIKDTK